MRGVRYVRAWSLVLLVAVARQRSGNELSDESQVRRASESAPGTGWVRKPFESRPLTAAGQVFRMGMYHSGHPDGNYQMANRVQVFDPPHAISWEPGRGASDSDLQFGGWVWRYDLAASGPSGTRVTLSYDWSAVPSTLRQHIRFPPFPPDHLGNSLAHLAGLVTA